MIRSLVRRLREALAGDRGAALAEYAMLLAVVAVVLAGTMGKLSKYLQNRVDRTLTVIKNAD